MRILCLHGRRQSASTFAKKIFSSSVCDAGKAARQSVVLRAGGHEFVFIDGPNVSQADLPKGARARQVMCEMYSWWGEAGEDNGKSAVETVKRALEQFGPCDGVLGFSQGGALAASLCRKSSFWHPSVAIFLSAYYFDAYPLPSLLTPLERETPRKGIQSLHVWGEKDQVVPGSKSQALCDWLNGEPQPFVGGHATPSPPWADTILVQWLDRQQGIKDNRIIAG